MEIGPIAGIRPIPMIRKISPDLSGVFAVELRKQAGDDAPQTKRAARGLEDEEADDAASNAESNSVPDQAAIDCDRLAAPSAKVSFFA